MGPTFYLFVQHLHIFALNSSVPYPTETLSLAHGFTPTRLGTFLALTKSKHLLAGRTFVGIFKAVR